MHSWRHVVSRASLPLALRVPPPAAAGDISAVGVITGKPKEPPVSIDKGPPVSRDKGLPASRGSCRFSQQLQPLLQHRHKFSQLRNFHQDSSDHGAPKPSQGPSTQTDNDAATGAPTQAACTPTAAAQPQLEGTYQGRPPTLEKTRSRSPEGGSSPAESLLGAPPPGLTGPPEGPPEGRPEGTERSWGRRRRHLRLSRSVAAAPGSSSEKGEEGGPSQQQSACVVTGRSRGRAARKCLRATQAWLSALLPQNAAAAANTADSAAAALAVLARKGPRARGGGSLAASLEGPLTPTHQVAGDPAADAAADGGPPDLAEAQEEPQQQQPAEATPPTAGRRRRGPREAPLGVSGVSDALSSGGAINFQFPVLFNKAIKRLLKSLLRRSGQQQRRSGSRPAAPTAAPAAGRCGPRPPPPPRVLLRSWRPPGRATASGSNKQTTRARQQLIPAQQQQQQQLVQQQLAQQQQQLQAEQQQVGDQQQQQQQDEEPTQQQDLSTEEEPRELRVEQQEQQSREADESGAAAAADLAPAAQQEEQQAEAPVPDEAAAASAATAAAPVSAETSAGALDREAQQEEEAGRPSCTQLPPPAAAAAGSEPQKETEEQQAAPAAPSGAVGRAAARSAAPRRSPPMSFFRQRVSAVYRQVQVVLSPHLAVASDWLYRNGNVLVTVGSLLSLTATLMADMRLLRSFNLLAGCCYFAYNWSRRPRLADAALWNAVFLALNAVMLWRVHTEHREVAFSSHELDIFQRYFLPAGMSPRQFRRLIKQGVWLTLPQGHVLQREGSRCETLCFVVRGTVALSQGGETLEVYRAGETGAVVGVEPFLIHIAALRKTAAKRNSAAAPAPPETFASHADESPDALQRYQQQHQQHQQQGTSRGGPAEGRSSGGAQQQQQPGDPEVPSSSSSSSSGGGVDTPASAEACQGADALESKASHLKSVLPLLQVVAEGAPADDGAASSAAAAVSPDDSLVAAAAEAAAAAAVAAAAATRTAAATALSSDGVQTPQQLQAADAAAKQQEGVSPPTAAGSGESSKAPKAQQQESASPDATPEAAKTAEPAAPTAAAAQQQQQQQQQQRGAGEKAGVSRGESEELERSSEEDEISSFTATCTTEVTVLSLDIKEFAAFVLREPENLGFPVVQGLTTLLIDRSRAQAAKMALHSYDAFLAGVFADGVVQTDERKLLEEFRRKRAISQAQHEEALARLGWTPEEFERGSQGGEGMISRIASGLGALFGVAQDADSTALLRTQGDAAAAADRTASAAASAAAHPQLLQQQQLLLLLPPVLEDWELVEDARAVPPHTPEPPAQPPQQQAADCREESPAADAAGVDAVSYAFEEEAAPPLA